MGSPKFYDTGSIARQPGSGRPSKVTAEIKELVEAQMRLDDETTAFQLHNRKRLFDLPAYRFEMSDQFGLDVLWLCLLPADQGRQQDKAAGLG